MPGPGRDKRYPYYTIVPIYVLFIWVHIYIYVYMYPYIHICICMGTIYYSTHRYYSIVSMVSRRLKI